eukprot:scaffold150041_cov12-Tisochrysis_lutea.AAC.1
MPQWLGLIIVIVALLARFKLITLISGFSGAASPSKTANIGAPGTKQALRRAAIAQHFLDWRHAFPLENTWSTWHICRN